MKKLLLTFFITASFALCNTNSYDAYGQKTGSFRQNGSTINQYDRYGSKTGSHKTTDSTIMQYDKYGAKVGSYK